MVVSRAISRPSIHMYCFAPNVAEEFRGLLRQLQATFFSKEIPDILLLLNMTVKYLTQSILLL